MQKTCFRVDFLTSVIDVKIAKSVTNLLEHFFKI